MSKDADWREYREKSENLYIVPELEKALALIRNAPPVLKMAVHTWLDQDGDGSEIIFPNIELRVANLEFSAVAYPTFGSVDAIPWGGELQSVIWPQESEIDVIDFEDIDDNGTRLVLSMPLDLVVRVSVELDFSVWDGVDKESVDMGGRIEELDEGITVLATFTIDVYNHGTEDEEILFADCEFEDPNHEIDLGGVDVFLPEDTYEEEDQPID